MKSHRLRSSRFSVSFNAVPHMKKHNKMDNRHLILIWEFLKISDDGDGSSKGRLDLVEERARPCCNHVLMSMLLFLLHFKTSNSNSNTNNRYKGNTGTISTSVIRDCVAASGLKKSALDDVLESSGLNEDRQVDFNEFQQITKSATDKMKGYFNGLRDAVKQAERSGQRPSMTKRELEVQLVLREV